MTTYDMFLRVSSFLSIYYDTFRLPANRFSRFASALQSAYPLFPAALGLPRHISTMSRDELTQHKTHSIIRANEELVGQSGRHYLIERVLQSKEVPPSHVYLATWVFNKLCCQYGETY